MFIISLFICNDSDVELRKTNDTNAESVTEEVSLW